MNKELLINLSRIGKNGTGLFVFSKSALKCLETRFKNIMVVSSKAVSFQCKSPITYVPRFIAMSQSVSKIRPILWYLFSLFFFPHKKSYIYTTTHHIIPGAKHQIITIHDLRPYFYPDSILQKIYFRYVLRYSSKRLDGILTVSEASRQLIHKYYRIPLTKIYVVPPCAELSRFFPKHGHKMQSSKPYLLMTGASWPHKNAHEVIENCSAWSKNYRLKILCSEGAYRKKLQIMVKQYGIEQEVDFVGYVSEAQLIDLYQNASTLIYPSLMEGFGIPPLEAMACGIPVIVSNIPVFREVYDDAPIYIQLGNPVTWEQAFSLLGQEDYVAEKIQLGLKRVKEYTEAKMFQSLETSILKIWPELERKKQ